ncbi:MAG TPA: VOC family protein [Polyangia bacterium]|nr:VOC family protein [Polyangia bacterium]
MQKITTFLWFDDQAEQAAKFYVSVFPNSKILAVVPYSDAGPGRAGSVMTVDFELDGQEFVALNGGPQFPFTEAISLVVNCDTQAEIDRYWDKLSAGGKIQQCGWLKDKYGLSWQIVPTLLAKEMRRGGDPDRLNRIMKVVLQSVKLDIAKLKAAAG